VMDYICGGHAQKCLQIAGGLAPSRSYERHLLLVRFLRFVRRKIRFILIDKIYFLK